MTYYHETKDAALAAGAHLSDLCTITAELEPYNGWVTVLRPNCLAFTALSIPCLMTWAEVDWSSMPRLRARPATHRKPAAPAAREIKEAGPAATWKPGTKMPWD